MEARVRSIGDLLKDPRSAASAASSAGAAAPNIPRAAAHIDSEFKRQLARTRVLVLTARELVEGTIAHHQELRVSDALNAATSRENAYIALSDVAVHSIETGEEILRSRFLMVPHDKVVLLLPESEIVIEAEERRSGDDRRSGADRRTEVRPEAAERRSEGDRRDSASLSPPARALLDRLRGKVRGG